MRRLPAPDSGKNARSVCANHRRRNDPPWSATLSTRPFRALSADQIWLSAIALEEILAVIQRLRSTGNGHRIGEIHENLALAIRQMTKFQILPYDSEAERIYQVFSAAIKRIGPQDCRIAAQAMANDLIVVTANVRDFSRIGARYEDWQEPTR